MANKNHINQIYDKFYVSQIFDTPNYRQNAERECQFIINTLKLSPKNQIADLQCGAGIHAHYFSNYFQSVTGVDLSSACIDFALVNFEKAGCNFLEMDVKDFYDQNVGAFDLITNLAGNLGYAIDDQENDELLTTIAGCVKSGGFLVIQFLNRIWAQRKFGSVQTFWTENSQFYILDKRELSDDKLYLTSEKLFIERTSNRCLRYKDTIFLYDLHLLQSKLEARGLKIQKIFASHSGSLFDELQTALPILFLQRE